MNRPLHAILAALVLSAALVANVAAAPDPSGHWEGAIQAPDREVAIEVDLAKTPEKTLAGTFSNLSRKIQGLPLASVTAKGAAIHFELGGNGGGAFDATLSSDGKSMTGNFTTTTPEGEMALPFHLSRNGVARIEPLPTSPPIRHELEGTWNGGIEVDGKTMRLVLVLANRPDGRSAGSIANLDQGGVAIPISSIGEQDSVVKLEVKIVGGSFTGALNQAGTELTGKWTQAGVELPVSFRRPTDTAGKK